MPFETETEPIRFQCRHIFTDGRRCASPCLRNEEFCYYHHTTRLPIQNPKIRKSRRSSFTIPLPEDRSAIQHSIGEVLQRIASNDIDPRRAGLLLYGLQIASLNLPKESKAESPAETVAEITHDPTLGTLAPPAELGENERKGSAQLLLEHLDRLETPDQAEPATVPTLQAVAEHPTPTRPCRTRGPVPSSPDLTHAPRRLYATNVPRGSLRRRSTQTPSAINRLTPSRSRATRPHRKVRSHRAS